MIIRVVEAKARVRGVAGTYRVVLQGVRGASATDFFLGKFALKRLKIALKTVKTYAAISGTHTSFIRFEQG